MQPINFCGIENRSLRERINSVDVHGCNRRKLREFYIDSRKKAREMIYSLATIKYGCYPLRSLWNIWDRTEITMDLSRTEILLCFGRQRSDLEIKLWWQNCAVNQKGIFLSSLCTICSLKCSLLSLMSCFSKIYYSGLAFLFLCVLFVFCFFWFFVFVFVSHWSIHFEVIFQGVVAWIWVMSTILSTVWKKKLLLI